jgi:APA family basic amino acid/polyamine antiporter
VAELKRTLGLPALLTYGIGVIVGAGIYSIVGAGAGEAGRLLWLSFVLAAIPAALAALCYAELIGMYPRAGAEYVFVEQAWPKRRAAAFAIGFVVVMTNAATAATVSLAFGGYLAALTGVPG